MMHAVAFRFFFYFSA
ncbi:TPA: pheST operon leader peptide PheM [Yersinia enterocolitica]|nr:pheST operon leader peptide PheM [Yersinia enterocolitica]